LRQRYDIVNCRKTLSIQDYTYSLHEERIAKYPLYKRDQSKLLIYRSGNMHEDIFRNIEKYIPSRTHLFYNNTRVIHARLLFHKPGGAIIEVFCLSPYQPSDYQQAFSQTEKCVWECMVGNLKKWKSETIKLQAVINNKPIVLNAEKTLRDNKILISFSWNSGISFGKILDEIGNIPIPPYLNRKSEEIDKERYQTIYSKLDGSVAAPTAGLHFTSEVIEKLYEKEIILNEITLHVGAGTFQPIKSSNAFEHKMHGEVFTVSGIIPELLSTTNNSVVATGTTSLRALESLYWLAVKSMSEKKLIYKLNQWDYNLLPQTITVNEAFRSFLDLMKFNGLQSYTAETEIMIVPGYEFKIADGLITNFHMPKSTLLLLIAAFVGDRWKDIYNYAQENDFRFLSYGDSSLLWR
jgi:S-adenosylmethionine:tRNA ribosyltransferase-isomerase